MKIYISHSGSYDYKAELYAPLRNSKFSQEHEIILPHEFSNQPYSSKDLFKNQIDLLIAEVSYPSTGMGIELGWADLLEVEIAAIYKFGTKPSSSVFTVTQNVKVYKQENLIEVMDKLINSIQKNTFAN